MNPEEFRNAYFEQYAEDGDVCDDAWFTNYFDSSTDWLEVEYRAPNEGFVVYSDPESDIGGFWATTSAGEIEGPYPTMAELAVALGYSPRNFPPDGEGDDAFGDEDDDDFDDEPVEEDEDEPAFDDDFDDEEEEEDDDED